jgi:diguanylate cyclase (GGDEF)-like protein
VPLEGIAGVIGVVAVYSRQSDAFSKDHLRILLAASSKLGLSIENSLRFEQAENSAGTDFLTGLPNGRALFQHLQKQMVLCKQEQKPLAVLVCDVDGFKQINDRHGHLEGDRFLRRLSAVMKDKCRGTDYVARMGGDEFVVVLSDADELTAARMKDRLREASAELAGYEFGSDTYALSIGSAQLNEELSEPEEILAEADRRMYQAKRHHHAAHTQPAAQSKRGAASSRLRIVS